MVYFMISNAPEASKFDHKTIKLRLPIFTGDPKVLNINHQGCETI